MSGSKYLKNLLDGADVEWKPLGEIVKGRRGKRLVKSQLTDNGNFAVFQNSMKPLGYYHESNAGAGSAFIICGGAAGEIGYSNMAFWAADDVYYFLPSKRVLGKYIYYWLFTQRKKIMAQVRRASIPRLPKVVIERLAIPLPCPNNPDKSLAIQHEIVNILDTFSELQAELQAELEARRKQYQYYRDQLLSFNTGTTTGISRIDQMLSEYCPEGVEYNTINEICSINRGRVISKDFLRDHPGPYPVYSSQTTNDGIFGYIDTYDYDYESITWTTDGAKAGSVFYHSGRKFSITNVCGLLRVHDHVKIIPRFLYYALQIKAKHHVSRGMGNPKLMSTAMARIRIPVPPLRVQHEIVSILDKFDALVNDLSIGLPAEINARRKQYEYYRDLLLSFPESGGKSIK